MEVLPPSNENVHTASRVYNVVLKLTFVSISRPSDCGEKPISNTVESAKPTKHDIHFDLLLSSILRFEANIFTKTTKDFTTLRRPTTLKLAKNDLSCENYYALFISGA